MHLIACTELSIKMLASPGASIHEAVQIATANAFREGRKKFQRFDYCLARFEGDTVAMSPAETRDSRFSLGALIVENRGWTLTHITLIFRPTTSSSRDKFLSAKRRAARS